MLQSYGTPKWLVEQNQLYGTFQIKYVYDCGKINASFNANKQHNPEPKYWNHHLFLESYVEATMNQ